MCDALIHTCCARTHARTHTGLREQVLLCWCAHRSHAYAHDPTRRHDFVYTRSNRRHALLPKPGRPVRRSLYAPRRTCTLLFPLRCVVQCTIYLHLPLCIPQPLHTRVVQCGATIRRESNSFCFCMRNAAMRSHNLCACLPHFSLCRLLICCCHATLCSLSSRFHL